MPALAKNACHSLFPASIAGLKPEKFVVALESTSPLSL